MKWSYVKEKDKFFSLIMFVCLLNNMVNEACKLSLGLGIGKKIGCTYLVILHIEGSYISQINFSTLFGSRVR